MKIDLSNPPYAVKLNELGFTYSYTDREEGVIVYTHAEPRLVGSPWINCWDDMECIIDFEDANCMKPSSFTFKNLRNGVSKTIQASKPITSVTLTRTMVEQTSEAMRIRSSARAVRHSCIRA